MLGYITFFENVNLNSSRDSNQGLLLFLVDPQHGSDGAYRVAVALIRWLPHTGRCVQSYTGRC